MRMRLVLAVAFLLPIVGCANSPDLIALREGMDHGTATIREQQLDWATKISNRQYDALPMITPADLKAITTAHDEYNKLVKSSRDKDRVIMNPFAQP